MVSTQEEGSGITWGGHILNGGSHSEYDNHVLNYVRSRPPPPSAGMSPLAQRNFITLPSLCCGVTGGQKPALTPWGHLLGSPPRCTLWLWHNFAVRRHKSLCRGVFCVSGQSVKERKENNPDAFCETAQLAPFYNASGGQLCSNVVVFRQTNFSKHIPMSCN